MKVATRVVAMLAILASVSVANAATHVWLSAVPTGGGAGGGPGGIGTNLTLTCDTTVQTSCTWAVTLNYLNDGGDEVIAGWASDLSTDAPAGKINAEAWAYAANNFTSHSPALPTLGAGPSLVFNANGSDFSGGGGAGGVLATFTLRKTKAAGSLNVDHISMTTGSAEWAGNFGDYPDMQAGGNAAVAGGGAAGNDLGVVATITNTPEPASLALLGLGALALIRRRR